MPAHLNVPVDYASQFECSMFLIVVDAYCKWMEVVFVHHATSQTTIDKLEVIFNMHCLPKMLMSGNGTPFTSAEFQEYVNRNAIHHVLTSPYHPASNGLAERAVQLINYAKDVCWTNWDQNQQIPLSPTPDAYYHYRQRPARTVTMPAASFTAKCHETWSVQDCSTMTGVW